MKSVIVYDTSFRERFGLTDNCYRPKSTKCINRQIYKGKGRPRKEDYWYLPNKLKNQYIAHLIGEPIIPKAIPDIIGIITN